ncbi:hypothetical protein FOA52_012432 [Chlamydomonas sp. UWO 241]|nr:hypothetical protein FOA52_012432 [Chlamydomonas sp. UWO 241]
MDRQMAEMDRQMTREMDSVFRSTRDAAQRARQQGEEARGQAQEQAQRSRSAGEPEVRVERFEDRGPGRFTYYESVHITSSFPSAAGAYATPGAGFSPLLVVAALAAGAYAAVTAAFARAYHLTTYRENMWKWALILCWPVLAIGSRRFRQQLVSVLQGKHGAAARPPGEGQGGGGSAEGGAG